MVIHVWLINVNQFGFDMVQMEDTTVQQLSHPHQWCHPSRLPISSSYGCPVMRIPGTLCQGVDCSPEIDGT